MVTAPGTKPLKIVAAIPCFNEERYVGDVVRTARKYADQVFVIDDGSQDKTSEEASRAGAQVIGHQANRGYGESLRSCLKVARESDADILVVLDGDGQHDPDQVPQVVGPILSRKADVVIGSRFLGGSCNVAPYREFGIRVITWLFNLGSRVKVSDAQSGFRAYSRPVIHAVSVTQRGMSASIEILIQARGRGFSITEVPISCLYHPEGSTLNPVRHGLGVALKVVLLRWANMWHRFRRRAGQQGQ